MIFIATTLITSGKKLPCSALAFLVDCCHSPFHSAVKCLSGMKLKRFAEMNGQRHDVRERKRKWRGERE